MIATAHLWDPILLRCRQRLPLSLRRPNIAFASLAPLSSKPPSWNLHTPTEPTEPRPFPARYPRCSSCTRLVGILPLSLLFLPFVPLPITLRAGHPQLTGSMRKLINAERAFEGGHEKIGQEGESQTGTPRSSASDHALPHTCLLAF